MTVPFPWPRQVTRAAFALLLSGCGADHNSSIAQDQGDIRIGVGWAFDPSPGERDSVRVLLYRLLRSQPVGDTVIDGDIERFGSDAKRRYLLIRSEKVGTDTLTGYVIKKWRLYVLGPSIQPDGVSEPFDTGLIDTATSFETLGIRDFDDDSLPDFAYCGWHLDGRQVGPVAVGFRSDSWYVIEKPSAPLGECLQYEP